MTCIFTLPEHTFIELEMGGRNTFCDKSFNDVTATPTNKYLFEAEIINKLSSKANVPNEFKMLVLV